MDYTNILVGLLAGGVTTSVWYYYYKYIPRITKEQQLAKKQAVQGFKNACTNVNFSEMKKLYEKYGPEVCDLTTGLVLAANKGHKISVKYLLDQGADNYNAGLYAASEGGHNECIQLFLEKGATNVDDCLKLACQKSNRTAVKLLLKFGANPSVGIMSTQTQTLIDLLLAARKFDVSSLSLDQVD